MAEELNGQIFETKTGWGSSVPNDFVLPNELTVTITLREYRELVKKHAEAKIAEAQNETFKLRSENNELKQKIKVLEEMMKGDE